MLEILEIWSPANNAKPKPESGQTDNLGANIWKPKATPPKPAEPTWAPKPESK